MGHQMTVDDAHTIAEAARMVQDAAKVLHIAASVEQILPDSAPRLTLPYVEELTATIELGAQTIRRTLREA